MLKVSQIFHAGHIISDERDSVLFDPLLFSPFSELSYCSPPIKFDYGRFRRRRFSAVFVSHDHYDHFDLASLDLLSRETPIFIYTRLQALGQYLEILGFKDVHLLDKNFKIRVGAFKVSFVANASSDFETGFLVQWGSRKILNLVDCRLTPRNLSEISRKGPFDLCILPFRQMNEPAINHATAEKCGNWPLHLESLELAKRIPCRSLALGASQIQLAPRDGRNVLLYPISRSSFKEDLCALGVRKKVVDLSPGRELLVRRQGVVYSPKRLDFVRLTSIRNEPAWDPLFRPNLRVSPSARSAKQHLLDRRAKAIVENYFASFRRDPKFAVSKIFQHMNAAWRIDLLRTNGGVFRYYLKERNGRIEQAKPGQRATCFTELTTRSLVRMFDGEICESDFLLSDEVRHGGYLADLKSGESRAFLYCDCPLIAFLCTTGMPRYYLRTIAKLSGRRMPS